MEDNRINLLKSAPVSKAVNSMAAPSIVGLLVSAIYNIVDTMFVSWLGTTSTAATQVVFFIIMLITAISFTFGIGGGGYLSRLLGANQKEKADQVATVSLFIAFFTGIILTALLLVFLYPVLRFYGASGDVLVESHKYGTYIILGTVFWVSNVTMNNLMRSEGSARFSMIAMATGALLNIILDPLFIFTFNWGIRGAAIATTLSQGVTFVILLYHYINRKTVIHIYLKAFQPTWQMMGEILKIGVPTFLRQFLFSVAFGIQNQAAVVYGGDELLAATGLILRITLIPLNFVFGLGQGVQPVLGYNYGADNMKRVYNALKYALILGAAFTVIWGTFAILLSNQIFSIFKPSRNVLALGTQGLFYMSISLIFMSFNNTISVFFQSIGKGTQSMVLGMSRQGFLFISLCFILPPLFGIRGVLLIQPIADLITMILCFLLFRNYLRNVKGGCNEKKMSYASEYP